MFPKTIKLIRVVGPLPSKTGGEPFFLAAAEFPNPVPGGFSTIRVQVFSTREMKTGQELAFNPVSVDFQKGECRASF